MLVEATLVAAVIGLLPPWFAALAAQDTGRDARFAAPSATVRALAEPANRVTGARSAVVVAVKNEAMCALLRTAAWHWAAWAAIGWALLALSRSRVSPAVDAAIALIVWAGAAWAGRVPWSLSPEHVIALGRPSESWFATPARFVVWMLAIATALLALGPALRSSRNAPKAPGSVLAYPGLVLATGIGWLLILDLCRRTAISAIATWRCTTTDICGSAC